MMQTSMLPFLKGGAIGGFLGGVLFAMRSSAHGDVDIAGALAYGMVFALAFVLVGVVISRLKGSPSE